ncbi:hypothetical protein LCGC14_1732260 [marine sediment metagenome]|uniref:Uncharacterized protein n=1 Tax=marine sediment metagenome TaxID=412755 RepID=A0A0F9JPN0_9ZZZZ
MLSIVKQSTKYRSITLHLEKELYNNLEGVLSVERHMKKVLKVFDIEYNLKK